MSEGVQGDEGIRCLCQGRASLHDTLRGWADPLCQECLHPQLCCCFVGYVGQVQQQFLSSTMPGPLSFGHCVREEGYSRQTPPGLL